MSPAGAASSPRSIPSPPADYQWRLSNHLLPYFAWMPLTSITVQEVDRYKQSKVREGALSAESINKTFTLLATILQQAVEYELIDRHPFGATAEARKRRRLRTSKPRRSYLDGAGQIAALLNAAGELDARAAKGHPGHRHIRRRAMLATLTFAGLRLGELLALRWRDVDLGAGRLWIADAKTDAGVRDVRLLPGIRTELAGLPRGLLLALVFPTSSGRQIGATNLRRRVLAPAIELANARLAEVGEPPLPAGLTPHSLRRTFASVLYALGETPVDVQAAMGHTDPKLALAIYAHAMRRDEGERERLQALVARIDHGMGSHGQLVLIPARAAAAEAESRLVETGLVQALQ